MSDNSAWWLLIPVLCVGGSIATVVLTITLIVRRTTRGAARSTFSNGSFRPGGGSGSAPLGPDWTPDGGFSSPSGGHHASGGHAHGWGHDMGHHHSSHDSGSSWSSSDSGSSWSSSDSGSSSSDSGSSSSSDSGSSSSSSSD